MTAREKWFAVIEDWETSGEKQQAYCKARSLSYKTFSRWRTAYKKEISNESGRAAIKSEALPAFQRLIPSEREELYSDTQSSLDTYRVNIQCPNGFSIMIEKLDVKLELLSLLKQVCEV